MKMMSSVPRHLHKAAKIKFLVAFFYTQNKNKMSDNLKVTLWAFTVILTFFWIIVIIPAALNSHNTGIHIGMFLGTAAIIGFVVPYLVKTVKTVKNTIKEIVEHLKERNKE